MFPKSRFKRKRSPNLLWVLMPPSLPRTQIRLSLIAVAVCPLRPTGGCTLPLPSGHSLTLKPIIQDIIFSHKNRIRVQLTEYNRQMNKKWKDRQTDDWEIYRKTDRRRKDMSKMWTCIMDLIHFLWVRLRTWIVLLRRLPVQPPTRTKTSPFYMSYYC